MTISIDDVKLLKSQRLTDEDDGGGRATGQAVIDGEENNLFADISRLDRTLGRINLRKAFAGVMTQNNDPYLGAHAIVTERPGDPRVSVLLFKTDSQTGQRAAARAAIESYVVPSVVAPFELLGNQMAGQRAIACIQREEQRLPEVGDVFQLVAGNTTQYIRCAAIDQRLEEFVHDFSNGTFTTFVRRRIDMTISSPLLATFPGGQATPTGTSPTGIGGQAKTQVLSTQVADAARYYGISPLAVGCAQGDLSLRVQSVYAPLVPSAVKEVPLIDQPGGYRRRYMIASGPSRTLSLDFASAGSGQSRAFLGTGVQPGSVQLTIAGGVYQDNSLGELRVQSGSAGFSKIEIDYETGQLSAYRASVYVGSASATYVPAAAVTGQTVTGEIRISLGNRGYAYTLNLAEAKPRPGTLTVSFMALGKWYELRDDGAGTLAGNGTGSMDYATGGVTLSLEALPDVGSSLIYSYIVAWADETMQHIGTVVGAKAKILHRLPHDGVLAGSLVVTYQSGGATKTLTDQANGTLAGDGGGIVVYATGELSMELSHTPDSGTAIHYSYEQGAVNADVLAGAPDAGGMLTGIIPGAPLKPGSIQASWQVTRQPDAPLSSQDSYGDARVLARSASDDGAGGWAGHVGTIDYQTGVYALKSEHAYSHRTRKYMSDPGVAPNPPHHTGLPARSWAVHTTVTLQEEMVGSLTVRSQTLGLAYGAQTNAQPAPALTLDLLPMITDPIVPGSLIIQWGGHTYIDRDGVLFRSLSTSTNAGEAAGTIDYASGQATLSSYPAGVSPTVNLRGCLTSSGGFTINSVTFRTPGAPLRPASLQITGVRADNAQIVTAVADLNGNLNGPVIYGTVDTQTGITRLRFTSNPADTSGASDVPLIATLLRYNAVLQTSLPMSADLLGLDPVRLPADGRVPIFREGEVLVVHHTATTEIGTPTAGQVVGLSRDHQADITVRDASGAKLNPQQYSVDLKLGRVTFANPLVLETAEGAPLQQPLTVHDRVEHMTVCTDVQITGVVGINSPMPWDLPAEQTQVSSAVTWGDMQARIYSWFTQRTWNTGAPNWSDVRQGDSTTAQFDQLNYPPIITNMGAIAGKWALVFTGSSAFQVVEQQLGIIANGTTGADCAPINPATGTPYFTIPANGWGSGWAASNAIRFNTDSCLGPMWIVRTILAGQGTVEDDTFKLQVRGDAD